MYRTFLKSIRLGLLQYSQSQRQIQLKVLIAQIRNNVRLFTRNNNRRYIHFLDEIAHRYNNSYHRNTKMKPIEVSKKDETRVWINLYENKFKNPQTASQQSRLSTGDLVRISIDRGTFKKG